MLVLSWPTCIAIFVVVLTVLYRLYVRPRFRRQSSPQEKDEATPPGTLLKYRTIWSFSAWAIRTPPHSSCPLL